MSSEVNSIGPMEPQCVICCTTIDRSSWFSWQGREVVRLPCTHSSQFHKGCLATWLQEKATCPLCRANAEQIPSLRNRAARLPPVLHRARLEEEQMIPQEQREERAAWIETFNPEEPPSRLQQNALFDIFDNPHTSNFTRALAVESIRNWTERGFDIDPAIVRMAGLPPQRDPDEGYSILSCCCLCIFIAIQCIR